MTITPAMWISFCLISFVLDFLIGFVVLLRKPKHKERVFEVDDNTNDKTEDIDNETVEVDCDNFVMLSAKEAQAETEKAINILRFNALSYIDETIKQAIRFGETDCKINLIDIEDTVNQEYITKYLVNLGYTVETVTYAYSNEIFGLKISWKD